MVFGNLKSHGYDLECARLRHADELSLLTLAVGYYMSVLFLYITRMIQNSQRELVDREDRRDMSIFQIGLRFTECLLINSFPCPIKLCGYR